MACDGSNINPVALALLNFKFANGQYAIPNPQINLPIPRQSQLPVGQSTFAIPAIYKENQFTANLDQVMTEKNTLSGRFFYSRAPTIEPFSPNAANVPGWGTNELDQNTMFVLADTHVFNSNLVNVARFGLHALRRSLRGRESDPGLGSRHEHAHGHRGPTWRLRA